MALGNRGTMVEAVRQCGKDRKEWSTLVQMELNECVLLDRLPVIRWLSPGEGCDAVT